MFSHPGIYKHSSTPLIPPKNNSSHQTSRRHKNTKIIHQPYLTMHLRFTLVIGALLHVVASTPLKSSFLQSPSNSSSLQSHHNHSSPFLSRPEGPVFNHNHTFPINTTIGMILHDEPTYDEGVSCKVMATGNVDMLRSFVNKHHDYPADMIFLAPPGGNCARTECDDTSATYLCSHRGSVQEVAVHANEISNLEWKILSKCNCFPYGKLPLLIAAGTYYTDDYAVWVGYGNCNHGTSELPWTYKYKDANNNGVCI
ncbi:hypothetical protein QBC38DRAFT_466082 [Podospora fimiseda]|uniref:Uncharacterized protein n=1 Tax=Podospora fimiseda TaxID=252190 RepID=A0AAN7BXT4_9PEZI|nr:hypothetical protein QBC38DRAFT_466082 [Podospora fimiseda]